MTNKEFRKDIAGLRAIAVLLVIAFHLGTFAAIDPELKTYHAISFINENVSAGFLGVDVFFVISGFLMTSIIFNKVLKDSQDEPHSRFSTFLRIWGFWKARAKRICPALLVAIVFVLIIVSQIFDPKNLENFAKEARYALTFVSNFRYARDEGYFETSALDKTLLHTWSLSVEWQFYIIYPVVLAIFKKFFGIQKTKTLVLVLTIAAAAYTMLAPMNSKSYYMLHVRAWELLIGGVVYLYPCTLQKTIFRKALQIIGLLAIFCAVIIAEEKPIWSFSTPALAVIGCALVIWANCKNILLDNPVSQYLGNISYSLYIYHWPILVILSMMMILTPFIAIAATFILSALSYHFIEKKRTYGYKFLVCFVAVFALNMQISKSNGWEWRIDEQYYDKNQHVTYINERGTAIDEDHKIIQPNANIWLVGDSHADHFYKTLNQTFGDQLNLFALHGTLFNNELLVSAKNIGPAIDDKINEIQNLYSTLHNQQEQQVVILSHRWSAYFQYYNNKDNNHMCFNNNKPCYLDADKVPYEEAVYQNLDKLFSKLSHVKFVIIGSLYPINKIHSYKEFALLNTPLSRLYKQYFEQNRMDTYLNQMSYQDINLEENIKIDNKLELLAKEHSNVYYYDLKSRLCQENKCRTRTDEGNILMFDDNHLTKHGSDYVLRDLIKLLKEEKVL